MSEWHVVETLGPQQARLASGALLIRDQVIGRTGQQVYHHSEILALDAGDGGDGDWLLVERDPEQVFDPRSMASFEGAPLVLGHPDTPVSPENWRTLAVGQVHNVRRGKPPNDDKLVADVLVQDQRGIDAVRRAGWRGLSCGYDADYAPIGRGRLRQTDITGNHLALLPRGIEPRCGSACMVGDARPPPRLDRSALRAIAAADAQRSRAGLRRIAEANATYWTAP